MVHILPHEKERMGLELMSSLTGLLSIRTGKKQTQTNCVEKNHSFYFFSTVIKQNKAPLTAADTVHWRYPP